MRYTRRHQPFPIRRYLVALGLAFALASIGCVRGPRAIVDVRPQRDSSARIEGLVVDARGVPISGVAVMASAERGRSMALTDETGRYLIQHLVPGEYEVTFDPCQLDSIRERVVLREGASVQVDAQLGLEQARVTTLPTPALAGSSGDERPTPPVAGNGASAEARRELLREAALDADEIWIIARTGNTSPRTSVRRRYAAGLMCAYVPASGKDIPLPLGRTDVRAHVSGHVASVDVAQTYRNPFKETIEALYVFPLPETAAVGEFIMTIGKRRIRGIVRDRDEAQRIYDEARAGGYVAALLTQQRPNVFTQRVANIEPGKRIDVSLTYYHLLPYRDGAYTFVFPTVVGPRYTPPGNRGGIGAVRRGDEGRSGQPTEVVYSRPGASAPKRFSMTVDVDAGMTIEALESPNYAIESTRLSATHHRVTLAGGDSVPNKDYVLRYKVAGDRMKSAFMVAKGEGDRYFSFILQPPEDLAERERGPIDLVVVLDKSASMTGGPLRTARRSVAALLGNLEADDRFRVLSFAGDSERAGEALLPTRANIHRALADLDAPASARVTRLELAIAAALKVPLSAGRERVVAVVSDGYAGNEAHILELVRDGAAGSRVLAVGIGTAVNRYLMERLAQLGNGAAVYIDTGDDQQANRAIGALLTRLSHPVLSDISLDFGSMDIREVFPAQVPDLLVGQPVIVTGKLRGGLGTRVRVTGTVRGQRISYDLYVRPGAVAGRRELANLWARMKIADLSDRVVARTPMLTVSEELEALARRHGLLSPASAILGIDTTERITGGPGKTVRVPVPLPDGVEELE
ncbi:MAG TPA: VIT domain-containing protein [Kofleriaceae bacterium]|nr:VIT domain-containing protein [Kofleriaceae bacterium]